MANTSDILHYKKKGFDGEKYINLQKEHILNRISKFPGRLYLEIGGKFMFDSHAARVLPGFNAESKKIIFSSLKSQIEILFCVNAKDILQNRQLSNQDISYKEYVTGMLKQIEINIGVKPHIVINNIDVENMFDLVLEFEKEFQRKNYKVWERYKINGYPHAMKTVLSDSGFGNDDHIPLNKNLILVTGAASNSGKMSTCLGQIYLDNQIGIESGYAKYETFPIWDLPVEHPVNLAYEAATVDIGDYNCIDPYYQKATGKLSTNYNRDVEAFEIVMNIASKIVSKESFMNQYNSPTQMGISYAGSCITDDEIISIASLQEIRRRKDWYQEIVDRKEGDEKWIKKCEEIESKCLAYCESKKYNTKLKLD